MSKLLENFQCSINGERVEIPIYHSASAQRKKMCLSYYPTKLAAFIKTPQKISKKLMFDFLQKHLEWLKIQVSKFGIQEHRLLKFEDGVVFLFKGKNIILRHQESLKKRIAIINEDVCLIECPKELVDRYMRKWLIEQTKAFATQRSLFYAQQIQKKITALRVKDVKTRWGSCSSLGNLNYNWRLIMAPENVFDYICAHEVAHLVHMNHSKDFWNLVQQLVTKDVIQHSKKWLEAHKKAIYQFG